MPETQPLIKKDTPVVKHGWFSPYRRILFSSFWLSVAFMYTQAPLIYAYRTFNCDYYYEDHPAYEGPGDRCAVRAIERNTASSLSLMATITTLSGFGNLMMTRWYMARFGIRFALVMQTFWPCLRNLCQIWGIYRSSFFGIVIFQVTQTFTILGGGLGYLLAANSYVAAVVAPEERTAAFGVLQGMAMLGTAFGYTFGGLTDQYFGAAAPFKVTFVILVSCCFLTGVVLPYIPPAVTESEEETNEDGSKQKSGGLLLFVKPLKVFMPRKVEGKKYYGAYFLGLGVFGSVLATQYVPLMLQLIGTNLYGFHPTQNGYLMAATAMSRAIFLTLIFPRIIAAGRKYYGRKPKGTVKFVENPKDNGKSTSTVVVQEARSSSVGSSDDETFDEGVILPRGIEEEEIVQKHELTHASSQSSQFDLVFLRWSIFTDAILTACCTFSYKGWHIFAAAIILPLASGTAPAAKGVIMEMVDASAKADALSGIALVETAATVGTLSAFGQLFAHLSAVGKPNLVFIANGALALLAFTIFIFAQLPRAGKPGTV